MCTMWWTYFAFVPMAIERRLREARGAARGNVARNVFTFGHFPIVFGLVLLAVAAKHVVAHPAGAMSQGDLIYLAAGVALFVGGIVGLQWQVVRRVAPERIAVIFAVVGLCWLIGPLFPGVTMLGLVAGLIAIMQVLTVRRFERTTGPPSAEPAA